MQTLALLASGLLFFAAGAHAQMRAASAVHSSRSPRRPVVTPSRGRTLIGISGIPFGAFRNRGFGGAGLFNGGPYFYSDFPDSYDFYQPAFAEAPAEQIFPAIPVAPAVNQQVVPSPMLLELQGNQWVKVSSFSMPEKPIQSGANPPAFTTKPIPPAVLVFRDGHSEELSSYSIIGSSIYTKSDYWTSGAWTRTIRIADLDIAATLRENQVRGVKFELPSSPNEVMIRP
jgi:hypothetical protein